VWSGGDTCYNCGYVREKINKVIDVAGQLEELSGAMGHVNKQEFWSMMQYYIQYKGWSKGRAANTYREKFGVWPKFLNDDKVIPPSPEVEKFVQKKLYAFLKKTGRR